MTGNDTGKSMDDVLASIRRIVRSERAAVRPVDGTTSKTEPEVSSPGAPAPAVAPPPAGGADMTPAEPDADAPLDLTQAMRAEPAPEAPPPPPPTVEAPAAPTPEPPDAAEEPKPAVEPVADTPTEQPETEAVEAMLAAGLSRDALVDLIRETVRDELINGEIAKNISANVTRMIREEVAKATRS